MRVRKVGAEIVGAGWHGGDAILQGNRRGAAVYQSQGDGAVVATQAEAGCPGGLADSGFERGAAVGRVGSAGYRVIPQRLLTGRAMRRVAKNADLRFRRRLYGAGT